MDPDIFQEVSDQEIPELLEMFKQNLENYYPCFRRHQSKSWYGPGHYLKSGIPEKGADSRFCQYVEIMEEYKKACITVPKQSLYRYEQEEDSVYLFEAYFNLDDTSYTLFHIFTASKDFSRMEEALSKTERIPWFSSTFVFQATLKRFAPVVRKVAKEKGVKLNGAEEDLLWLPPDQDLEVSKVPDDLDLKFLDQSHAEFMNNQWKFKFSGSSKYLGIQIRNNFGLGLFTKSDSKMVCSAVTYNSGGIFCLFTDPESRGKGYAEIIVRSLAKELRLRQKIPFATVQGENIPSQKVFRRIGFRDFSKMEFISPPNYYKEYNPISVESN